MAMVRKSFTHAADNNVGFLLECKRGKLELWAERCQHSQFKARLAETAYILEWRDEAPRVEIHADGRTDAYLASEP